ncbi:YybH family protein [Dyella flagellata]|uniref:SnoaL-like domain-containing protein n=1 Tax=Dyella flagellata TaxID=1867833 RepID=A0ABQ5X7S3_9GAMM|nr:nuclear transport factor 2 family protein [Dyella flagellata]GLQ87282.1 hypothetical protein GCM10007898_08480 [Dyella flagellata]
MSDFDSQVMQVLAGYQAAVLAKDVEAFIKLYDQDVRVFDAWGTWSYQGLGAWRQVAQQWFDSLGEESVVVNMEEVRVNGTRDFALISALVTYTGVSSTGERLRAMENRLSWGLSFMGDGWKIVHEHTSAPIDFDDMKAILERD